MRPLLFILGMFLLTGAEGQPDLSRLIVQGLAGLFLCYHALRGYGRLR